MTSPAAFKKPEPYKAKHKIRLVTATALFDVKAGERIAGFIHLGTPAAPPLERDRPDLSALISRLD